MKLSQVLFGLGWLAILAQAVWIVSMIAPMVVRSYHEDPWSLAIPVIPAIGVALFLGAAWAQSRERKADDK